MRGNSVLSKYGPVASRVDSAFNLFVEIGAALKLLRLPTVGRIITLNVLGNPGSHFADLCLKTHLPWRDLDATAYSECARLCDWYSSLGQVDWHEEWCNLCVKLLFMWWSQFN